MRFLPKYQTGERVGYHPVTVMRKANDPEDDFPSPVKLESGRIVFVEDEIDAWIEARVATRDHENERAE